MNLTKFRRWKIYRCTVSEQFFFFQVHKLTGEGIKRDYKGHIWYQKETADFG